MRLEKPLKPIPAAFIGREGPEYRFHFIECVVERFARMIELELWVAPLTLYLLHAVEVQAYRYRLGIQPPSIALPEG